MMRAFGKVWPSGVHGGSGPVWKQWSIHVANKQQMNDCAPQRGLCSSKGGNLIKAQQHGFHRSQTRKHLYKWQNNLHRQGGFGVKVQGLWIGFGWVWEVRDLTSFRCCASHIYQHVLSFSQLIFQMSGTIGFFHR